MKTNEGTAAAPAQSMELVVVQTAITRMDKLAAGLADLQQRFGGVVFAVTTPKGMAEAKAARREVAAPRIEVERVRKEAKAPILELGRKLDAEAKRITAELDKVEGPIAQQITTEENRVEAERLERVRREEQRVADIQSRIQSMRNAVGDANRVRTSKEVAGILLSVQSTNVHVDLFAEFTDAATLAKRESVGEIERIRDELVARETEAERLRKDREDFERQRAEQEAIDKAARDKRAAEIAAEDAERRRVAAIEENNRRVIAERQQAERDAENARIAAEQAAAQKVIDDQRRELEARQQAERDAQVERECEEREATEAREREARETEEARIRAEAIEKERNYRPTFDEIVALLAANYRVEPAKVRTWITEAKQPAKRAAA